MREFFVQEWANGGVVGFVMRIFILYFCIFFVVAIVKRVAFNKKRNKVGLEKYEDTMGLYLNTKKEMVKALKSNVPFQTIFWAGVALIWISVSNINVAENTKNVMFIIGAVLCGVGLVAYFVKYSLAGGYKGIEETWKANKSKYKPPEYVKETTYVRWDDEPESQRREVSSVTYDKNADSNALSFIINILGYVFKIISFVALAVVYLLIELYESIRAVIINVCRPLVRLMAKRHYYNFVMEIAKDEGFIYKDIYYEDDVYDEIPQEVAKELLVKSNKSIKGKSSKIFVFAHFGEISYFTNISTRKFETSTDDGKGRLILAESKNNRIILPVVEDEDVNDCNKFLAIPIPYRDMTKFYPIVASDEASKQVMIQMMTTTQYFFLKEMKVKEAENKKIQLMSVEKGIFVPVIVSLKDVWINGNEKTYSIAHSQPVKHIASKDKKTSTIINILITVIALLIGVPQLLKLFDSPLSSAGASIFTSQSGIMLIILALAIIGFIISMFSNKNKNK